MAKPTKKEKVYNMTKAQAKLKTGVSCNNLPENTTGCGGTGSVDKVLPNVGRFSEGGLCYKGNCQNGYGEIIFWNGGLYQGQFKKGIENGKGTGYDSNNHVRYTGGHKDGEYDGYGVEINYWPKYENGK
ncbi:hypothetical protein [Leptospira yanagawae]|uniref:hypothetical protein n=1 Tax=Leptospira yanagawae TaxID=293069 RepID=UPI0006858F71|nr:hypothetical protein [Leptospira yanagawae]